MKYNKFSLLLLSSILLSGVKVFTQQIVIANNVYKVNQTITASITGFNGTMGIENDIKRLSETKTVNGPTTYLVGSAPSPGQYLIKFKAGAFEKSFLIFIVPAGSAYSTTDLVKLNKPVPGLTTKYMNNLVALSQDEWKQIMKKSVDQFLTNHTVSGTTTFVVCVTAAATSIPSIWVQCGEAVTGNVKDMTLIILQQAAVSMKINNRLTQQEFSSIKVALATFDFLTSALGGFKIENGKIKLDGVEMLTGATTYVTDLSTANDEIQAGVDISTDFVKKFNVILKMKEK